VKSKRLEADKGQRVRRLSAWMLGIAAAGGLLTAAVSFAHVDVAYRVPELHVAIETAATLSAALAAYLFLGRFRENWRLSDLLLVAALGVLAASNLFFSTLPTLVAGHGESFSTWASIAGQVGGAGLFAASALWPNRRLRRPSRAAVFTLTACGAALGTIALLAAYLGPSLPRAVDPAASPSSVALMSGNLAVLLLLGLGTVLFAAAAVGFARRARRSGDELTGWLAIGAVLAALYLLFPSLYSDWVNLGDGFRLAFYVALLTGAFREIGGYQQRLAGAAVLEERRRVARELHDGLAQELAFISAHSRRLRRGFHPRVVEQLAAAADRALDESRGAISSLAGPLGESFDSTIAGAAQEVAHRHGVCLTLKVEPSVDLPPKAREAMRRIVREAVANAGRHGEASSVRVDVTNREVTCRLRIVDDGSGFQTGEEGHETRGFGLISMRERAAAIGGELHVRSTPGDGTEVEVVLP
jgi:signal transduction histidine kinase